MVYIVNDTIEFAAMKERWRLTSEFVEAARTYCRAQHGEPQDGYGDYSNRVASAYNTMQRALGALEAHERLHGD
tara:strand:- start:1007 stop:1228 length:222 start_codon:yes stop_codon:yes gene_type:complete